MLAAAHIFFNAVMMLLSSLLTFSCLPSARAEAGAIDASRGEAPAATWSFQPFFAPEVGPRRLEVFAV